MVEVIEGEMLDDEEKLLETGGGVELVLAMFLYGKL